MAHSIKFKKSAEKEMDELPQDYYSRVLRAIIELADEPRPKGCVKLKGRDGYRVRVGVYRVLYEIFDNILTVCVVAVRHRKDAYK